MLEIFVEEISDRAVYTFDFILKDNGIDYKFTNDYKTFENSTSKKLNYSNRHFENVTQLIPSILLFEESIEQHVFTKSRFQNEECLEIDGITDPFAAVFYVLSRMEEYGDILHDEHERFPAKQSILYRFGWLDKMVCERWSRAIIQQLYDLNLISFCYKPRPLEFVPTFDIDNAFAYKYKEGNRKLLATLKDYSQRDKRRIQERKDVISGKIPDPYDTYSKIISLSNRGYNVRLFWLLGNYGQFDRNISYTQVDQKLLIQELSKSCTIGIHPSYKSFLKTELISEEIKRLTNIIGQPITSSRQHFLKFRLPNTYRQLILNGIKHDYTMGYASEIGYRAGTSRPFFWFDLEKNATTSLLIHPFAYMDGTLLEYKKWSIEEAKSAIQKLYDEFTQFGGEFIFLWHNETIGDYGNWKGWSDVLEWTLTEMRKN